MSVLAPLNEPQVRSHIHRAVGDVFRTMLGREPSDPSPGEHSKVAELSLAEAVRPQIVGSVGFVGEINGLISLHFDLAFARRCTRHLLGMTDEELVAAGDDAINDAIGEIATMTVGRFTNGLCDLGYASALTIPSIVRGSNFVIEPISSITRHVFCFQCGGHRIIADVLIQNDE